MSTTVRIGRWLVEAHPDETRRMLETRRGADNCACECCARFRSARDRAFTDEDVRLLRALGVDAGAAFEVTHWTEIAPGEHLYTVDFELMGRVIAGGRLASASTAWTVQEDPLDDLRRVSLSAWEPQDAEVPQVEPAHLHLCIDVVVPW